MQTLGKSFLLAVFLVSTASAEKQMSFSALTLEQASKQVMGENKLLDARTEEIEGKQIHVIKILSAGGRVKYLRVDAETGQLIK